MQNANNSVPGFRTHYYASINRLCSNLTKHIISSALFSSVFYLQQHQILLNIALTIAGVLFDKMEKFGSDAETIKTINMSPSNVY